MPQRLQKEIPTHLRWNNREAENKRNSSIFHAGCSHVHFQTDYGSSTKRTFIGNLCDRIYTGPASWIYGCYHCRADRVVYYGNPVDRADFPDAGAEEGKRIDLFYDNEEEEFCVMQNSS